MIGSYYGRGICLFNGRCLCWWGWIGFNFCYVDGGIYNNRIIVSIVLLLMRFEIVLVLGVLW